MEREVLKLTITGADLASPIRRMVVPTMKEDQYFIEVVKITEILAEANKTWDDIDGFIYVVGMRAPYHLNKNTPPPMPSTTLDGYEIEIHLK